MESDKPQSVLESTSNDLMDRGKELIKEGNARRLVIKTADDKVIVDTTLTIATAITIGALIFLPIGLPVLVLAVIAAFIARIRIDIIREVTNADDIIEGEVISKQKREEQGD